MAKCAGWNLHLDRCPEFDHGGKAVFSINVVMPYCRDGGQDVPMTTAAALGAFPQFLFPHLWRDTGWRLYWNGGAGVPVGSAALTIRSEWALDPGGAAAAAAAVVEAVKARCRQSADTFSIREEAFATSADGSSLAHALAHLTHWPAGLSDTVLARACYLELDPTDLARIPAGAQVAAFPGFRFDDGGGATVQFTPAGFTEDPAPPRWTCGDAAYQFTCQLQTMTQAAVKSAATPPAAVALTQSRLSTLDLRALVASHLHPLGLLVRSLAPFLAAQRKVDDGRAAGLYAVIGKIGRNEAIDAAELEVLRDAFGTPSLAGGADLAPLSAWAVRIGLAGGGADAPALAIMLQTAMVQLLGCGWDRLQQGARDTAREPHLYEILPDWPSLQRAAGGLAIPAKILLGSVSGDGVVTGKQAKELLAASFVRTGETDQDLSLVFDAGTDAKTLFASWMRLAALAAEGSTAHDFTLRWLQRIDGCFFTAPADAAGWEPIRRRVAELIGAGVNARSWYERNAQGTLNRLGTGDPAAKTAFWNTVQSLAAEAAKAEEHVPADLAALQARLVTTLCTMFEAELGAALPAPFVALQVAGFARDILQRSASTTSLLHEPGLGIVFDTGAGAADSAIRGYAIALRAGVPTGPATAAWDDERAQWITDTAFNLEAARASLLTLDSGKTAWLHETYGSTVSNGQRVVAADYVGLPLLSVPYRQAAGGKADIEPAVGKDRDFDDFAGIEFLWPDWKALEDRSALPMLGYGLCYQALATPIANAGGVLAACRAKDSFTRLQAARDVFADAAPAVRFRSRQRVDAPDVRLYDATRRARPNALPRPALAEEADAYAMSDQTRAAAWLAAGGNATRSGRQPLVALLTDDSDIWDDAHQARGYTLEVRPPRAGAAFVERWLNADVMDAAVGTGASTDPRFAGARPEQIAAFRDAVLARLDQAVQAGEAGRVSGGGYHPAVAAIGVAVAFGDAATPLRHAHPINPIRRDNGSYAVDEAANLVTLTVRAAAHGETSHYDHDAATLVLEHGQFACVTLYSLVESAWIAGTGGPGTKPRFHALADFSTFAPDTPQGTDYHACDGIPFVFEMAPAAPGTTTVADDALVLRGPDAARHATLTLSLQDKAGIPADWVHGAHYLPFDFHWTGYPLDLPPPGGTTLDWLPAHANANTERPDLQGDVVFDTSFGTGSGQWVLGKRAAPAAPWVAGIAERPLRTGVRPATHVAYAVQLRARFRAWLRQSAHGNTRLAAGLSPLEIEGKSYVASAFLPGIAPDLLAQRLPIPALRMAVPLTSTRWPGAKADTGAMPPRRQNGNMLLFDEAIRRTDDLATVGGVGEIIEVDVATARRYDGIALDKVGANPIFHKPPKTPTAGSAGLAALAPFGLTYDQSDNGLVVQTGIIVVPEGGAGGWLLAEVRTRRVVLPEVLMGTALLSSKQPGNAAPPPGFDIPLRRAGDDYVPLDFCIDVAAGDRLTELGFFKGDAGAPETLPLGAAPGDGYRLLISWHKGRYSKRDDKKPGDDRPTWRMQVLTQVRIPGQLEWRTVGKLPCAEAGIDWLQTSAGGRLLLAEPKAMTKHGVKVSVVPMSDYTEGLWLHFIGNFAAQPVEPDDFNLQRGAGNTLTLTARPGRAPARPACIALSTADPNAVEFHWLLVYRPLRDVTRSSIDSDAGALLGAWRYDGGSQDFHPLDAPNAAIDLAGCHAYLCTFQRNTALSKPEEKAIDDIRTGGTQALIECMFPDQAAGVREATIRMLPKVLGQFAIA